MRFLGLLLVPCLSTVLCAESQTVTDEPVTAGERTEWFVLGTVGPASLIGGTFSAGLGTWAVRPREYNTHWDGFGQRYGMRLTGIATSNAMEAGLGAFWGEDPRYYRAGTGRPFGNRVKHVVKWTFVAAYTDGTVRPAYGRYLAVTGSNFLSNTWREQSEADNTHAIERVGLGFLARMAGNAWDEFWPDVRQRVFHHKDGSD